MTPIAPPQWLCSRGITVISLLALGLAVGTTAAEGGEAPEVLAEVSRDDECSGVGGSGSEGSCALNALQLGARRQQGTAFRARASRIAHSDPGVELESSFFVGAGPSPVVKCSSRPAGGFSATARAVGEPRSQLCSSFGAGGSGEVWRFSQLVVSDGPKTEEVDFSQPVHLELTVHAASHLWKLNPCVVSVAALPEEAPEALNWVAKGRKDCPPALCLIPTVGGRYHVSHPDCGWAPSLPMATSVPGPVPGSSSKLVVDVTNLTAANYTIFKVWATPSDVQGLWQIPEITVTTWGFTWFPKV